MDPRPETRQDDTDTQHHIDGRERTFRVLTTGDVRDTHTSFLRNLAPQVAVEEVADATAVLVRLDEAPPPHLVVLGWDGNVDDSVTTLRHLHDSGATTPVLIVQPPRREAPAGGAGDGAEPPGIDLVRDAVTRLVTSIETLVTAAPAPAAPGNGAFLPEPLPGANPLDLRLDECRALWRGRQVPLSLTEFRVVARLAAGAGLEISHRDLYDVIKSEGFLAGAGDLGYRVCVRATIKRIRQKFREVDPGFAAIRNYPGFGYRWVTETIGAGAPPV